MFKPQEGIGERGERVPGPPWILGHRGAPRDAPENTLSSLALAIDLGLDGVEYDLHACASGEPVLIHDETLDRTTDGHGPVSRLTLPELAGIDAGGWFHKSFRSEPLPLLEEALELPGNEAARFPQHMIEIKDPTLVREVERQLRQAAGPLPVRIASFHRGVCLEARDLELPTMLLALEANEADRRFVRDEGITAFGTAPGGWRLVPFGEEGRPEAPAWECERWSWAVDEPDDLYFACRAPLNGFNTNEPLRALATRALVRLTPHDDGPYPLTVPPLPVAPGAGDDQARHGAWSGRWRVELGLRNPFAFRAEVAVALAVRGGAFEVQGLPVALALAPGEARELEVEVAGGSWSPGDDPLVFARYAWRRGPGRPEERLVLDATLARTRTLRLSPDSVRLEMLREHPGASRASMTVRRRGRELLAWVEHAGGLEDLRAKVRLDSAVRTGGRGVRIALPEDFERRHGGVPFAVGFEGRAKDGGARRLRRWSGGLPYGLGAGAPARLFSGEGA